MDKSYIPTEPRQKEGVWVASIGMLVFVVILFCTLADSEGAGTPFWCTLGVGSWIIWAWGCLILLRSLPRGKARRKRGILLVSGLLLFGLAFLGCLILNAPAD